MNEVKPLRQVLRQGCALMRDHSPCKQCITNIYNFILFSYQPQSGKVGQMEMENSSHIEQTITSFADQTAGWTVDIASTPDATMDLVASAPSTLASFLGRPVRIGTYNWGVGQPLLAKLNPWALWCTEPHVREKMANYNLFRCKLHIKVVISGTGFHYGRAMVGYNPWSSADNLTVTRNFLEVDLVQLSQKPSFFLNPSINAGGEMVLPFFYNHNYANLPNQEYNDLGDLYIKSMQDLAHANGGDDPVRVTVFAWAEDLTLTMPTSQYTAQSGNRLNTGDEYGKGIISSTASAIAEAAGSLSDAPVIGPYARATEVCARAGADVARHFGYSRPPVITDQVLMKPLLAGNLANTDAADAISKLTLDSKQEITVDSRTVGLDGADHMDIKSLVMRQSYLTQFTWTPTNTIDTMLWNSRVGPALYRLNGNEIHPTPMSMIQNLFEKWQGTIKFRFQVVKSAFHKGRLLIRWDPNATSSIVSFNTVYSRVIDIAEEDDFEIEIGWGQSEPFLNTDYLNSTTPEPFGTGKLLYSSLSRWNGIMDVSVLNPLVSPSVDSPVQINVFVSMCDDAKFGAPTSLGINNLSLFKGTDLGPQSGYLPQSGVLAGPTSAEVDKPSETTTIAPIAPALPITDTQMQVFFGESPKSLRELFRRYVYTQMYQASPNANELALWTLTTSALPDQYGWDPNGPAVYFTSSGSYPCTVCHMTPLSFMIGCYAGWRGSLRKKFLFWGGGRYPVVSRAGFVPSADTVSLLGNTEPVMQRRASRKFGTKGFNGVASQDTNNNGVVECEVPYYIGKRMSPARIPSYDFNNGAESVTVESILNTNGATVNAQVRIFEHCATGEDFSLFFFVGCPIFYEYNLS